MHGVIKMKKLFTLIILFLIVACTENTSVNSQSETTQESVIGWRSAGFTPVISSQRGGGLQKVTHSGNWLVLMDAWTSPIEGKPGTSTYSPRLFISKIGSGIWDTLEPPTKAYVKTLYADSLGIYVGTYNSEVIEYNPEKKEWTNLNVKSSQDSLWYHIYGIHRFGGKLIVSMAGYDEILGYHAKVFLQNNSGWQELQIPRVRKDIYNESLTDPLYFVDAIELGKNLYVCTIDGVWKLDGSTLSWTELPKFPKMRWNSDNYDVYAVQDLIVYKDNLIAVDGTNDRVYQWDGANNWVALDSVITPTRITADGDTSYFTYNNSLLHISDIATDGKHLFISGDNPCPKVYMGDYGEPYGNILKGWRKIKLGWCKEGEGCVSTNATYSLDIIGDTIYAAAWEGLFKMPLSDLDTAIAGESDFSGFGYWEQ
jgi:hypothetical protein